MNYQALSLNNMYMSYEGGEERRNTDHTLFIVGYIGIKQCICMFSNDSSILRIAI